MNSKNNFFLKYASVASQFLLALMIATFIGRWIDQKKIISYKPLFIWLLPILIVIGMLVKLIKDTSKK